MQEFKLDVSIELITTQEVQRMVEAIKNMNIGTTKISVLPDEVNFEEDYIR